MHVQKTSNIFFSFLCMSRLRYTYIFFYLVNSNKPPQKYSFSPCPLKVELHKSISYNATIFPIRCNQVRQPNCDWFGHVHRVIKLTSQTLVIDMVKKYVNEKWPICLSIDGSITSRALSDILLNTSGKVSRLNLSKRLLDGLQLFFGK